MLPRAAILALVLVIVLAGCGPDIEKITPTGQQRLQMVKVEGIRMTGAVIDIDGEPVGAAMITALSDPVGRRDVVIPLYQPDNSTLTGAGMPNNRAVVRAWDSIGNDTETYENITSPTAAPTVTITSITPALVDLITNRVVVMVQGTGIYPAAGAGKVTPDKPFAGPQVLAIPGNVPADPVIFLAENTVLVFFPWAPAATPGHVTSGTSYQIAIKNDPRYGSGIGTSVQTFTP